jgi:hypothetical protein
MKVLELITELQKFPAETEVEIYAGKCCEVQPINYVQFQPSDCDVPALVILVDDTQQICVPGRCNCH